MFKMTPASRRRRAELLARERPGDRTLLWRVGAWSGIALASVVVAIVIAKSPTGARHGALVAANAVIVEQAKQLQQYAQTNEREGRRLTAAVETLNADRNRLFKRVTDLEHNLDTVTGSITRSGAAAPSLAPFVDVAAPATLPAAAAKTVVVAAAPKPEVTGSVAPAKTETKAVLPAPPTNPIVTVELPKIEVIRIEPPKSEPAKSDAAKSDAAKTDAAKTDATKTDAAKTEIKKTDVAKADIKADIKADVTKTDKTDLTESGPAVAVPQTRFGIDLGQASSVEGLRAIWAATRKAHGALMENLQPIITVQEQGNGLGMQLRLVAGPMTDAAMAAKLCAKIADEERPCKTAVYDGQRLSMRSDTKVTPAAAPSPPTPKPPKAVRAERKAKAEPKSTSRFGFPSLFQPQQQN